MRARVHTAVHTRYDKFFRIKLLISDSDQILEYVTELEKDRTSIQREALKLAWHMRGGLTYNEAMGLSYTERQSIGELIKDNLETTKKSGLPYF